MDTTSYENCDACDGSGNESEYETEYARCHACAGRGYLMENINERKKETQQ
jgi:DnaJ-class molecular chaperone